MPYIKDENGRRKELRDGDVAKSAGELNYQIFAYIKNSQYQGQNDFYIIQIIRYVEQFLGETPNYQKYNDMVGCLNCCYKEVKRRLEHDIPYLLKIIEMYQPEINIYEDIKIKENGDV